MWFCRNTSTTVWKAWSEAEWRSFICCWTEGHKYSHIFLFLSLFSRARAALKWLFKALGFGLVSRANSSSYLMHTDWWFLSLWGKQSTVMPPPPLRKKKRKLLNYSFKECFLCSVTYTRCYHVSWGEIVISGFSGISLGGSSQWGELGLQPQLSSFHLKCPRCRSSKVRAEAVMNHDVQRHLR